MAVLIPNCLSDLQHLKTELSISTTFPATDSDLLESLINACSRYILRICMRSMIKYASVTEYVDGHGSAYLTLKSFPIISITSIYDDPSRDYEAATLIAATDYEINNAEAGVVRYLEGEFSNSQSNVKVTYVAGYSDFTIIEDYNDQIAFLENTVSYTATIVAGTYNASTLATAIKTALDAAGGDTYTVTYNETSHRFKIASDGDVFTLSWLTDTSDAVDEFGKLIGFDIAADDTGALSYIADYPALGIPEDLIDACNALVRWRYSSIKERRIGLFSESRGEASFSFDFSNVPVFIKELIAPFIIRRL